MTGSGPAPGGIGGGPPTSGAGGDSLSSGIGVALAPDGAGRGAELRATVRDYQPATRSGTLLRDDGTGLSFPGAALDPAVRLLRPGQRVRLRIDAGAVAAITLLSLPLP